MKSAKIFVISFSLLLVISYLFVNAGQKKNIYLDEFQIDLDKNHEIFQETLKYIQNYPLPTLEISIYDGSQNISHAGKHSTNNTFIVVVNKSSFQVAHEFAQAGYKPLVLDMANKESPGGSVLDGSEAQEETLCRQSNLYIGLKHAEGIGYYPITEYGGILVKNVTFFRDDKYDYLAEGFQADVFASAAYDCNKEHKPIVEKHLAGYDKPERDIDYENGMKAKIRASLRAAKKNGNDALVFSAFGCGSFRNDPKIVSQWYKDVFDEVEFLNIFKFVVFAIIPENSHNFKTFQTCFSDPNGTK